jgi:hypothetical protein
MNLWSRLAALIGAVVMVAALATSAQAADKSTVAGVTGARNPAAAFLSLSSADRAQFREAVANTAGGTISGGGGTTQPGRIANAGGCWYWYQYMVWKSPPGYEADTWMQLDWCSNGRTITGFRTSNWGGSTARSDFLHYDGVQGRAFLNVGWEVRSMVEFHYNYYSLNWYPCEQIRGGATGLYSVGRSCSLA